MSLKAFHILFIAVSTLLTLGFGIWCLQANASQSHVPALAGAIVSFALAAVLIVYGIWFLRKLKHVSFM